MSVLKIGHFGKLIYNNLSDKEQVEIEGEVAMETIPL